MEEILQKIVQLCIIASSLIGISIILSIIQMITKIRENIKEAKAYELLAEEIEQETKAVIQKEKREQEQHKEFLRVQKVIEKEEIERTTILRNSMKQSSPTKQINPTIQRTTLSYRDKIK